ncbi:MAG: hypothetical protein PF437_05140 [Sulfurimonas sp.]|jgi:hypothetical protein|nr:hypothetical protein [Sulfurimonas sp.]
MSKSENIKLFLKTGMSHIEVAQTLVEKLQPSIEYLTYNLRRYKVPVSLVLFYTQEDISQKITDTMRLTDILTSIKIGDSYFNFVFLPFTDEIDSYTFVKHVEKTLLKNIDSFFHFERLDPTIHNYFNFINSYLFEIEKEETFF